MVIASSDLLHSQERRFYIMEGAGCMPATYWNAWGVLAMAFVPIAIAVAALVYTGTLLVIGEFADADRLRNNSE